MRILLLTTYFRPDFASTGVIMSTLADEFAAKGHEVTVLASVPHYDVNRVWPEYSRKMIHFEQSDSMRIYRLYTYIAQDRASVMQRIAAYGSFNLLSTFKGITLHRHDVILVPSPPLSNGVIADVLSRLRGTPFVYNVQDIWPDVAVRAGVLKNPRMIRRLRKMEDYVYRRAARIAVISEGFRTNLLSKGVPAEKISVIPNFIDTQHVVPQTKHNPFSQRHGLEGKFVALFAGNMGFSQGLETVLDAAKRLESIKEIRFLLVGNGAGRERAEAYLKTLNISNTRFLPFQPHESLPDMYGAADVCLIPLRRGFTKESVPCKLFSIMSSGKPAVAAVDRDSETRSLLEESGAGVWVEPENADALADSILQYFRDPVACRIAGDNGRRCVEERFRSEIIAEKYLDLMRAATMGNVPTSMDNKKADCPKTGSGVQHE